MSQLSTVLVDGSPHAGSLQHEIGGSEVRRSAYKRQHCGRERVRRVGHYSERPCWRDEVLEIALDYCSGAVGQLLPQPARTPGVQLDRDDPGTSLEERQSKSTGPSTQVNYQLAGPNGCAGNDSLGPVLIQPVPAPRPSPGHDAP
jgi:hypothetical protein